MERTCRGLRGMNPESGKHTFLPEPSRSVRSVGPDTSLDSLWLPFNSSEPRSSSLLLSNNQQQTFQDIESPNDALEPRQEQHCFFGKELGMAVSTKQEHNILQPLFNQWPKTSDLGSYPDDHKSSHDSLTSTQLSMSSATSDFFSRNDQSHSGISSFFSYI